MSAGDSNSPVLDFSAIDYASLRSDLLRFAQATCGLNLTDLNAQDPGVMLLSVCAYLGDLFGYNLNQLIKEAVPVLALRLPNFANAVKGLGYVPPRATPSTTTLRFTVDLDQAVPPGGPVTVGTDFKVGTEDSPAVVFQPDGSTTVGPGTGVVTFDVDATQGDEIAGENVATSTGLPNQRYALAEVGLLQSTLVLTVAGVPWERVDILSLALATDAVFAVRYDRDDVAFMVFGDGVNGRIPPAGAAVAATYKVGGGRATNALAGTITKLIGAVPGVTAVTNTVAAEGGDDAQTVAAAQAALPGFVRANDRAINETDYAAAALEVAGVLKATAAAAQSGSGGLGPPILVYAVPAGGGLLTSGLKTAIKAHVSTTKKEVGRRVLVRDAPRVALEIGITAYVATGSKPAAVETQVRALVADAYDMANVDFGATFALQDLYELPTPATVAGLTRIHVDRFAIGAHAAQYRNFPPTGDGEVLFVSLTASTVRREFQVRIVGGGNATLPGTFDVYERYVGTATAVASVSMTDAAARFAPDNGLVGATPPWLVRLNPYDGVSTPVAVVGNTETSVAVAAGTDLRLFGDAGEPYVVERRQVRPGVVYRQVLGALAGGTATLALTPAAELAVGTKLRLFDGGSPQVVLVTEITGGTIGAYTISPAVPAGGTAVSTTVDALWVSDDGALSFVVTQGDLFWGNGDVVYVDVHPDVGDVVVRPEDFPELTAADLVVRTVGGSGT